jgi:hypothetical protein
MGQFLCVASFEIDKRRPRTAKPTVDLQIRLQPKPDVDAHDRVEQLPIRPGHLLGEPKGLGGVFIVHES